MQSTKKTLVDNFFHVFINRSLSPGLLTRRDVVKAHCGMSKSSSSKSKSSDSEIVKSKSKSTGRKFKSSSSPSPHVSLVSLSFDLPSKKRQNLPAPYHLTTSTDKCMLKWKVRNTFYKCMSCNSLQSTQQIRHLAAWLFNVNNNFISVSGWLHIHVISIAFEKHNIL